MKWVPRPLLRTLGCLGLAPLVCGSATTPDALRAGPALSVPKGALWMTQATHLSVAALLVPIFPGVAASLGSSPPLFAAAIAVSASRAVMLPVATPPNAIVLATEQVLQATMMRCGLLPNGVCIVVMPTMAAWVFA